AEAMSDKEGALTQLGSGHHSADFFGAELRSVVRSPPTIAHAGQINRRDAKVAGEVRRNIAPPEAMRTPTMNDQKTALAGSPEPRVNGAILRSAAPPACSITPPCYSGAVGPGAIYPSLLRRDREGSNPALSGEEAGFPMTAAGISAAFAFSREYRWID